ncbi:hypothetical protein CL655_02440 [bacterium]|nr:hypothetical protein [bacterium]|tara:strand:+ start:2595 stop:3470 length:876 start_codon:yes stop_codon:yes gene_type:complete
MELWFWAAVVSAIMSGVGNFIFKIAAKRDYNSELFSMYGGLISIGVTFPAAILFGGAIWSWFAVSLVFLAGFIAATAGITKVYALRHIDTTIFFPIYKLVTPLLAIVIGIFVFAEAFSYYEWIGLALGLLVPLMLISKTENGRQNNLTLGLILLLIGAVVSAISAALHKYATIVWPNEWWLLFFVAVGIFAGSLFSVWWKSGLNSMLLNIRNDTELGAVVLSATRGVVMCVSVWMVFYAFSNGGTLAVVHTITSMYILIPIVLSIIFYGEHWNLQKAVAIILSVAALALLG